MQVIYNSFFDSYILSGIYNDIRQVCIIISAHYCTDHHNHKAVRFKSVLLVEMDSFHNFLFVVFNYNSHDKSTVFLHLPTTDFIIFGCRAVSYFYMHFQSEPCCYLSCHSSEVSLWFLHLSAFCHLFTSDLAYQALEVGAKQARLCYRI